MSALSVLVIEDNPQTRKVLRITLESQGYAVSEAEDATAALAQLDPAPDVIIQDLLLPDMDGLALRAKIRGHPSTAGTPVIAMSGFDQQLFSPEADKAGFAVRLRKPVEPSRLLATLQPYVGAGAEDHTAAGRIVLVADDSDIQRKLTVLRLRDSGYEVLEAADGLEALEIARRERPDAVVTDVLMPGMDGFELCRAIRAETALAGIPVILASSVFVEREDRELAEHAGANGFITREPNLRSVLDSLARAFGGGPSAHPDDARYHSLRAPRITRALLDRNDVNLALEAELEVKEAQVAVLSGISEVLSRSGDPQDGMEGILARCLEATGLRSIELRTPDGHGELAPHTKLGDPPRVTPDDVAEALAQDRPVVCGDGLVMALRRADEVVGVAIAGTRGTPMGDEQVRICAAIAHQLAQAVSLARAQAEIVASREQVVQRLATAIDLRDGGTAEHTSRVSRGCERLARLLGMPEAECEQLRVASAMHDIGKVAIPDEILLKPGKLTDEEFARIKEHPQIGFDILNGSGSQLLELAATIALCHHERWDGGGYPRGLRNTEIPLPARIAAVADVFDALTTDRPYRPAMTDDEAVSIMSAGRARHFDPVVLDAFLAAIDEVFPSSGRPPAAAARVP